MSNVSNVFKVGEMLAQLIGVDRTAFLSPAQIQLRLGKEMIEVLANKNIEPSLFTKILEEISANAGGICALLAELYQRAQKKDNTSSHLG